MFIQTANFLSNDSESSWHQGLYAAEFGLDTGYCKAFMESKDVGRTLDLTALGSYEELYKKLANMFGIERSEILNHVLYHDAAGTVKRTGDEPFGYYSSSYVCPLAYSSSFLNSASHLACIRLHCHLFIRILFPMLKLQ